MNKNLSINKLLDKELRRRIFKAKKKIRKMDIIPEIAFRIPMKEFIQWYQEKIRQEFKELSYETINCYLERISLCENVRKQINTAFVGSAYLPTEKDFFLKKYFEIAKFSEFENDIKVQEKVIKQFILERIIEKCKEK